MGQPCPQPRKARYTTKRRAQQATNRLHKMKPEAPPLAPYKCRCGYWHLTKRGALEAEIRKLLHMQTELSQ